ncbi:MAG: (deoxy)nucleoside triphosphate pyrophosphohydrolase [Anaerolineales bacterium]|nr:(deoxy)nucleoside triphosphate pyrophosphohydrolase [Anaerolineales bacterium]
MKSDTGPVRVTCALIIEDGGVLVTQRSRQMPHPMKWEFPGGKVKEEEKPEACIRREIREELSIEVSVIEELSTVRHNYGSRSLELIPFICQHLDGVIELAEHHSYKWVSVDELDELDWLEADVEVVRLLKSHLV